MIIECVERRGLEIVTGESLGGGEVPQSVRDQIEKADSLVALMTRRYKIPELQLWDTYLWVRDELAYAYHLRKRAIAVVESGVEVAGATSSYERITLDRDRPKSATDKLTQTLLLWTGKFGARPIKVYLQPAHELRDLGHDKGLSCRYKWWSSHGDPEEWERADIVHMAGGLYFMARRPRDVDSMIEVEILESGEPKWRSSWQVGNVLITLDRIGE